MRDMRRMQIQNSMVFKHRGASVSALVSRQLSSNKQRTIPYQQQTPKTQLMNSTRANVNRFMRERTARAHTGMTSLNAAASSSLNVLGANRQVQNFFQSRYLNQNRKSTTSIAAMRRNSISKRVDEQKPLYPAFLLKPPTTLFNLKLAVDIENKQTIQNKHGDSGSSSSLSSLRSSLSNEKAADVPYNRSHLRQLNLEPPVMFKTNSRGKSAMIRQQPTLLA